MNRIKTPTILSIGALAGVALLTGCQSVAPPAPHGHKAVRSSHGTAQHRPVTPPEATKAVDLSALANLEQIIPRLADKRVVFVGEIHDRFDHHLNQLEIIRRLHALDPDLSIGMEFFQQPFQRHLDDYIAGKLDERELLRNTEYYQRWRLDYRLYAPILQFAREKGIPLVALNLPKEINHKVARGGLDSLTDEERAQIPTDIDRSDPKYRERLKAIFDQHPKGDTSNFEYFLESQLLWDEGMAERAARYLKEHPGRRMVILAGGGHLIYGAGIPRRLTRRIAMDTAIVLNSGLGAVEPDMADFLLLPEERRLPPPGLLGLILEPMDGGLKAGVFTQGSAAEAAGMKRGDQLLALGDQSITDMTDVRVVMWDKRPGDKMAVKVRRSRWLAEDTDLTFEVELR